MLGFRDFEFFESAARVARAVCEIASDRHHVGLRQLLFTGEDAQEGAARLRVVVADGAALPRAVFARRPASRCFDYQGYPFTSETASAGEGALPTQHPQPHPSVCTSTDSTAGRSRTIGVQLSPASAEA